MNKSLKISVVRPGKQPINTEGVALQIPSFDGLLGIKPGRQSLLSILNPGIISITSENGQKTLFATSGGFAEVHNNVVSLLCDSIITTKEIPNTESDQVFYTKDITSMNDTEKRTYLIEMLRRKTEEN
ncbi:MAG: F0F1 ATP synthase subunit epsilon [Candidatus Riflebacteria bacterium]|nr:F0F1 ATP synthase subunit epsilon [Candidatus Riflebacteria bacterium]